MSSDVRKGILRTLQSDTRPHFRTKFTGKAYVPDVIVIIDIVKCA